jgi:hypothetical protein
MDSTAEAIKTWLTLPWYSQLLNFVLILGAIGFVFLCAIIAAKTIKLRIRTKKSLITTSGPETKSPKEKELELNSPIPPSLLHHRVFNLLSGAQSTSIYNIDISDYKAAIGLAFLRKCKYFTWEKELRRFITDIENAKDEVFNLTKLFIDVETEYLKLVEFTPVTLPNGIMLPRIPKIFVEKYEVDIQYFTEVAARNLEAILNSRYYSGWRERAIACLDMLCLFFSNSFIIAEESLMNLNGELDDEISKMLGASFMPHK